MKILFKFSTLLIFFFGTWFTTSQVDWINLLNIKKVNQAFDEKLGNAFWDLFSQSEKVIEDDSLLMPIQKLTKIIVESNDIDPSSISLHVIHKDEINAFALPNGHLVIYSGLIHSAQNSEELAGVLSHELAHIQLKHVMKKLIKEVGLSVLVSITSGGGGEIIKETGKILSSSAFDRKLEKEADLKAVDYLQKAQIDPENFANFLFRMDSHTPEFARKLSWISTHPNPQERAQYIINYSRETDHSYKPSMEQTLWDQFQSDLKNWNN